MRLQGRILSHALLLVLVTAPAATAVGRTPPRVRVVNPATPIVEFFPAVKREVLLTVEPGTTLEMLAKQDDWYWVMTPRDAHGTQRGGWVAARNVEVVTETAATPTTRPSQADGARPAAAAPPQARSAVAPAAAAGASPATPGATIRITRKEYSFDDVHFALNQSSLMPVETQILDGAANAMKDDPMLRLKLEGYTCNLGTRAYNLALGSRRANTVKDYLVGKGVSADRLQTESFGEDRPAHPNSTEETRRLNRRVALVPNQQP